MYFVQPESKKRRGNGKWTLLGEGTKFVPPDVPFVAQEKINATLPQNATAVDYLKLYFTDEMVDFMVLETNKYAEQFISSNPIKPHSRVNNWVSTDRDEMLAFLGLAILMGVVYKPRIQLYWSTDAIYHTDIFPSVMARDRFLLILHFLHFADNSTFNASDPKRDRLWKIRPFIQMIRDRCQQVYTPGQDLCVDESLLLFKGRLAFKQFIKSKRARFGIKLFELCTKRGVLLDLIVYTGDMSKELVDLEGFQISERIPMTLMKPYLGQGYRLFIDNFYTSPHLAEFFLQNRTTLVGTVRPNRRNFCAELVTADISRGESKFAMSDKGLSRYRIELLIYTLKIAQL